MSPRPLAVVHFCGSLSRGGAEEHVLTLLRGLDRCLFRLHLVCPPPLAACMRPDLPAEVEVFPLTLRKPWQAPAALRLARFLRRRRADILHVHQFYASMLASPVAHLLARVPVVIETPHIRELWRSGWKADYRIDRFFGRSVDHYIAVSEANAAYLREVKGFPPRKITVIHNGSDLTRFDPFRLPPPGFRARIGIGEADPVMLALGRLERQKGHRVLIDSMAAVQREFPAVRLFCLGDGPLRPELEARAAALGLEANVRFAGHQKNVEDWLALADFTVLASFFEGLPLVAVESLAAGRTVVGTAVDGTPEVVVNNETGLTVPPGDSAALAAAICRLLRDAALRSRLASAGRRWVIQRFDEQLQIRHTGELYLRLWQQCNLHSDHRMTVVNEKGAGA